MRISSRYPSTGVSKSSMCTFCGAQTRINASGRASVHERKRDRRVRGMIDRALPLDDDQIGALVRGEQHELFGRSGREVGDHAIDRNAPAGDHDPGLSGGYEPRVRAARIRRANELQRDGHLPHGAVVPDEQQRRRGDVVDRAREERHVGRLAHVPDFTAVLASDRGKVFVLAEHVVQAADDVEIGFERVENGLPPIRRQRSALRRGADQQRGRFVLSALPRRSKRSARRCSGTGSTSRTLLPAHAGSITATTSSAPYAMTPCAVLASCSNRSSARIA